MTIASELTKLNTNLTNAYTAVDGKGGTLPQAQNFDNLATAISSIPSGGGSSTKYGANIDTLLGDVDANGVLQMPTEQSDLVFTGVKKLVSYAFYYKFNRCKVKSVSFPELTILDTVYSMQYAFENAILTEASFPELTTISGQYAFSHVFSGCSYLTTVNLSKLSIVSAPYGMQYAFSSSGLTNFEFPELTSVARYGLANAFSGCTGLQVVRFPKLTDISEDGVFSYAYNSDRSLTDIYFNALTTSSFGTYKNQFNYMLAYTQSSVTHTLHFPSNLQSTISGLTGYPNFGGTNGYVVCAFDLPATS